MKIDFNASFKELSAVVNAPVRTAAEAGKTGTFTKLLGQASPQAHQTADISREIGGAMPNLLRSRTASREAMASFAFGSPSQKFGDLARLGPGITAESLVKEAPGSVKTPAILQVHRLGEPEQAASQAEEPRASLNPGATNFDAFSEQDTIASVANLVVEAGKRHGIDPSLSMAVASAESSFNPKAVSADGHSSKGLFQLLDSTGKDLMERAGETAPYEPFNPELNSNLGVGYLRYLHDLFSRESALPNDLKTVAAANSSSLEKLAVAAFNAGEGRVASAQKRAAQGGLDPATYENVEAYLPENTQEYVRKVMSAKRGFEARFIG